MLSRYFRFTAGGSVLHANVITTNEAISDETVEQVRTLQSDQERTKAMTGHKAQLARGPGMGGSLSQIDGMDTT